MLSTLQIKLKLFILQIIILVELLLNKIHTKIGIPRTQYSILHLIFYKYVLIFLKKSKFSVIYIKLTLYLFQDSQLEDDHTTVNIDSIPTQTFSSSLYSNNGPTDDAILKILSTPPQHRNMGSIPYKVFKN